MPSWHPHRQLTLLTHLEHSVEGHCDRCRSSFFVDSSRRLYCPLSLCLSSVPSRSTTGLLLTLSMCSLLLDLVELAATPRLGSPSGDTAATKISNLVLHRLECR